ncbi:MAG: DUF4870 domain-containing protein [Defluviitaleaceae bacterium]|nr:DUF4870 domain-containing protein [Defluviitaleaceae bacterium]
MKSIFNLDENIAAALSYVLGPISGIIVLVMEKNNKFVRFHALQSTLWFLMLMVASWILAVVSGILAGIPLVGPLIGGIIGIVLTVGSLLYFISKVFLIIKAYSQETYKLPIIGEVAWAQVSK